MARFLVEILINAAGGPQARAAFDDVGTGAASASKKLESLVNSGLQAERALRRTAESADRLQHQMEETKASKGLVADLTALNARTKEYIAAVREGAVGLERYEQKQKESALAARILQTQVKAGVSAQSLAGKEIAEQIRLHDRLQVELRQTAQAQLAASGAGAGGGTARISGVISSARSMIGTVAAVSATVVGLGYSVKRLTDAAAESQGVMAQLEAGVESTGGAAGHSVAALDDMASTISRLTGVDDELIASGEAILLTFTKVAGDVFPRATAAALDMSVRMKSDLNTTILQVGKALNDPIKGVTALTRAGVQFSASQKEMIKSLVESGDLLGAQTIILKELETQFGGSAAAARDTLGGALLAAQTESGNLVEILAGELSPILRELTEDYVAWAQSAEGQKQIADLGSLVADSLRAIVSAADLLTPALKLIAMEAKVLLTVINGFLSTVGFVVDRVGLARDAYLGWARDTGILKSTIADSTPAITTSLTTQLDAVFALREEYGKLGQAALAAARDQMAAMEAEAAAALTQAQKNRELLRTREETRKKNAQIGAQRDTGPNAADRELLRQTIELEKHGANLNNIITRQTLRLNEHAVAAKKSSTETGTLSDKTQSAVESAREAIAALALEADQHEASAAAVRASTTAHEKSTLSIKQDNTVLKIREGLLKVGIDLTKEQEAAIRSYVARIDTATKAEQTWLDIRKKLAQNLEPIKIDLQFEVKGSAFGSIESVIDYLKSLEEVRLTNQAALDEHNQAVFDDLMDQAAYFRDSLTSPRQALEDFQRRITELATVTDSAGNVILTAAQAERLRTQATMDFIDQSMSAWGGFFSYLGSAFGGVFQQISQMISSIQSGYQAGSQLGGMTSMGAAAGGAAGIFVAVVAEVYKYLKSEQAKRKAESYGFGAIIGKSEGLDWSTPLTDQGRRASMQIKDTLEALAEVMGGTIQSFADIEIKVRRDGKYFHAFVEDFFVGSFTDMQSAVEASILRALKNPGTTFDGVGELIRQGLEYALSDGVVKIGSLEELQDFLSKLREISDLELGSNVAGALESIRALDKLWETLARLPEVTDAVVQGFENLGMAEARTWQSLFDSITGRQKTQEEIRAEKEAELKIAKAELEIRKASIQQRILQARAEIAALKAGNALTGGIGGESGSGRNRGGIAGMAYAFALAGQTLATTTQLVAGTVTAATQAMIDALNAEIQGLEDLLRALGDLKIPDIDFGSLGRGAGGGGGGGDRQGVRDFIKDKRFELSLSGMSEYARARAELERQYDDLLKQAGKDKKLREELMALKEKEIALLEKEKALSTVASFEDFLGLVDPFEQVRKTAADLIKDIQESPFGDERKARMIGRVLAEVERQLDKLAQESALSLFGELSQDLEKYGADEGLRGEVRRQIAILEHTLKMAHYRAEIEILRAQGRLSAETMATLDKALGYLEGVDPTKYLTGGAANDNAPEAQNFAAWWAAQDAQRKQMEDAAKEFEDALKRAKDTLQRYRDEGLSPLVLDLRRINANFTEIIAKLGATPEILAEREAAIARAITKAMSGVQSAFDSIAGGALSGQTPAAQYASALSDYEKLLGEIRGGNFNNLDTFASVLQSLGELGSQQYGTSTGGYQDLRAKIMAEVGPLLAGTGLNLSQILSGQGSSSTNMTNTLVANNNTNTDRLIASQHSIASNIVSMKDHLSGGLSDVAVQLQLLNQNVKAGGSGLRYGT